MTQRPLLIALVATLLATAPAGAVTVEYTTKTAGAVSLGIYDQQGRLLRTLQAGKKQEAGKNTVAWDGKDDGGRDLPPGAYTLQGLVANLGWQYQMMMGCTGKPPWMTGDGTGAWGGGWGQVMDAIPDASGKCVLLLWKNEEGTPALLKVDPAGGTGKFKLWGAHNSWPWGNCQALAQDGQYVYVANNMTSADPLGRSAGALNKDFLWRVRADNGEYAPYPGNNGGPVLVSSVATSALPSLPRSWEMYAAPEKRRSPSYGLDFFSLAVDGTHLYCSLRAQGKLLILDKTTAALVKEVPLEEPGGLCLAPDGNLYALSGRKLLKLSPDGAVLGTVIESGLAAPYGLCVEGQGNLYVSDQGAAMQIKVYSPEGKLLRTVGREGGRLLNGEWARMKGDLLYPTRPAVLADGTLYVGEDCAPRRVAIFKQGKWADEWIGPVGGAGALGDADEANPQYLYYSGVPDVLMRYRVDYAKKTSALDAVWGSFNTPDGRVLPDSVCHSPEAGGYIRHRGGQTFLCSNGEVWRVQGYDLLPSARIFWKAVGRANDDALWRLAQGWKSKPAKLAPYKPGTYTYYPIFWTWHDLNGDGQVQENEVDFSTPPGNDNAHMDHFAYADRPFWDAQMNVYAWGYRFPCLGLDAAGNPLYSWSKTEPLPQRPMGVVADPKLGAKNSSASNVPYDAPADLPGAMPAYGRTVNYWLDPDDGGLYQECDAEGMGKGINWASSGIFARIGKSDKQGNWLWMAGSKATAFVKPGQFYKPGEIAGIAQGLLFVTDWNGQIRVWDKDTGLYAGSLFVDGFKGPVPDENEVEIEYDTAHVYLNRQNGKVYATAVDVGLKLYQVTGGDQVERFSAPVAIPETVAAVGEAPGSGAGPAVAEGPMKIVPAPAPVTLNGDLSGWNQAGRLGPATFDPEVMADYRATCYAMYNAANLYLAAVVVEPHPPYNVYPFRGMVGRGDDVTVRLSTNPALPYPLPGTRQSLDQSPNLFTVAFWWNNQKQKTGWEGYFGTENYGPRIPPEKWAGTELVVKIAPDQKGYTAEMKIPWQVINPNFHPQPGDRISCCWQVNLANNNPAEPATAYQIFLNGGSVGSFRGPGDWGQAVFQ